MIFPGKQERMVIHLEIGGQLYYYGNLKALCDHWDKDALGVGYACLRNYGIREINLSVIDKASNGKGC